MRKFFTVITILFLGLIALGLVCVIISSKEIDKSYAAEASWPNKPYTTVKAYLYNLDDPITGYIPDPDILKDGKLVQSVFNKDGVELTPAQTQRLIAAISKIPPHMFGMTVSASMCIFKPHHAFVFYDSSGTPVAYIEICLLCEQVEVSPIRKQYYEHDFKEIDALCRELNLPVFHTDEEFNAYRETLVK